MTPSPSWTRSAVSLEEKIIYLYSRSDYEYSCCQLPRILNACIDIATEDEGRVDQVLALMDISKLIVQVPELKLFLVLTCFAVFLYEWRDCLTCTGVVSAR